MRPHQYARRMFFSFATNLAHCKQRRGPSPRPQDAALPRRSEGFVKSRTTNPTNIQEMNKQLNNLRQMLVCVFVGLCVHLNVNAQVKLSVQYSDTVSVGKPFEIKYVVEGGGTVSPLPIDVNNESVQAISGPSVSIHTTTSFVNGKMETRKSVSFSYWFACAKPGTYRIPTLSAIDSVSNNEMSFPDDLTFFVCKDKCTRESQSNIKKRKNKKTAKDSFANCVVVVDKNKISLGDSVRCRVYLYSDTDLISCYVYKSSFGADKAIKHDIVASSDSTHFQTTVYNGREAGYMLLEEFYLIPSEEGKLKIAGQADFTFHYLYRGEEDLAEAFFNGGNYIRAFQKKLSI